MLSKNRRIQVKQQCHVVVLEEYNPDLIEQKDNTRSAEMTFSIALLRQDKIVQKLLRKLMT